MCGRSQPDGTLGIRWYALLVLLSVVGMAVSVELTVVHHRAYRNERSGCDISQKISCTKVARTKESEFLGVPISVWGFCTYAAFGALGLWGLARRKEGTWPWGVVFTMALAAVGYSAYLGYRAYGVYHLVCLWCTALYGVNGLLLALATGALVKARSNPFRALARDIQFLMARPLLTGGLAFVALTVAAGLVAYYPSPTRSGMRTVDVDISKSVLARPAVERPGQPTRAGRGRSGRGEEPALLDQDTPVKGSPRADVTVVEFSDYECPFCRQAHKNLQAALRKYQGRIRIAHRHFPLDSECNPLIHGTFHPHSCAAARAAICAQAQGKFWQMHDLLFEYNRAHTHDGLVSLARRCGLDVAAFEKCLGSKETKERLARDIALGIRLKLRGTPTFFLEGPRVKRTRVSGLIGMDLFDKLFRSLDEEPRAARASGRGVDEAGLHQ